ncbi:MAG: M48 family metallopeptidase [Candidatus Delongbacteria bacterium]|nr:M48 family metallopeptidase [Candidatus Delongbacteria bacterium]
MSGIKRWLYGLILSAFLLAGCLSMQQLSKVAEFTDSEDFKEGVSVAQKAGEAMRDFTPKEEYFIGRAAGATLLGKYPLYDRHAATIQYLNQIGQTLVMASHKPYLYKGYSVILLDDETSINAYATPGGHLLITRGLLKLCKTEDEVASILAHEIAHVCHQDAMASISKAKKLEFFQAALKFGGRKVGEKYVSADLQQLTTMFDDFSRAVSQAILNGYSLNQEDRADSAGLEIMAEAGYNPKAMLTVIKKLPAQLQGHYKAHRAPQERIIRLTRIIGRLESIPAASAERNQRFTSHMAGML